MGAIEPSAGPVAASGASFCTLCMYLLSMSSPSLLPCLVDFTANDFTPLGFWPDCRHGCTATASLLIFSSLDGTSSVRLKVCCTAAPRLLICFSLDGTSNVRLKLCCTAAPRLLIFSSLGGTSSVRLKACCTAAPRLLICFSLDGTSSVRLQVCCTAAPRLLIFSSLDGISSVRLKLCCTAARGGTLGICLGSSTSPGGAGCGARGRTTAMVAATRNQWTAALVYCNRRQK